MRTTLDIDDDVLLAAKELARREKRTIGATVSALARSALTSPRGTALSARRTAQRLKAFGIEPLPSRGGSVNNELIERLREQEGV
jgi:hypothetical protein